MSNEFKLDNVSIDSDLSLLDSKFERGGDIYTSLLDTTLGALQKYGEIQRQRNIDKLEKEQYKTETIEAITYDNKNIQEVGAAKKRLEDIMKNDFTKADEMPYYAQKLKSKYNRITKDEENLRELDKSIKLFQNPTFEDADGNMIDYNFDAFVEGGFYDQQGIKGDDLEDKIDEAIEYNTALITKIVKLGGDDGGAFSKAAQQKISDLESIKAYIGNTGTFTEDEKDLLYENVSLRDAFDDANTQYTNSYRQIGVLQEEIDKIQPDPDGVGDIALTTEKRKRLEELEVALDLEYAKMGEAKKEADLYYNEFKSESSGRKLKSWSNEENQSSVTINDTVDGKIVASSNITIDGKTMTGGDVYDSINRLEKISKKSPQNIESSQYYGMYESLLNIDANDPLMDMEIGDKSLKEVIGGIKSNLKKYKDHQNLVMSSDTIENNIINDVLDVKLLDNLTVKKAKSIEKPLMSFDNRLKKMFGDDISIDDFPPLVASYMEKSLKGLPFTHEENASLLKFLQSDDAKDMLQDGITLDNPKKVAKILTRMMTKIGGAYSTIAPKEEPKDDIPAKEMDFRREMLQGVRN